LGVFVSRNGGMGEHSTERGSRMKTEAGTKQMDYLRTAHAMLNDELESLNRRAYLTPSEQQRTRVIKKEKLRTKDRIRLLSKQVKLG
jgi:hypothetical protein